jgi:hypothetical protein
MSAYMEKISSEREKGERYVKKILGCCALGSVKVENLGWEEKMLIIWNLFLSDFSLLKG